MPDPEIRERYIEQHRKRPNHLLIFVLACLAIFLFLIGAWLVLRGPRYRFLPPNHRQAPGHAWVQTADGGAVTG